MFTQTVNNPRALRLPFVSFNGRDMKLCNFYCRYVLRACVYVCVGCVCVDRWLYSNELRRARLFARVRVHKLLGTYYISLCVTVMCMCRPLMLF